LLLSLWPNKEKVG